MQPDAHFQGAKFLHHALGISRRPGGIDQIGKIVKGRFLISLQGAAGHDPGKQRLVDLQHAARVLLNVLHPFRFIVRLQHDGRGARAPDTDQGDDRVVPPRKRDHHRVFLPDSFLSEKTVNTAGAFPQPGIGHAFSGFRRDQRDVIRVTGAVFLQLFNKTQI